MPIERLALPEPAAGLWKRIRTGVEETVGRLLGHGERWSMGGGTILGARWGHRRSTDIDLKVPKNAGLGGLRSEYGTDFENRMSRLGATGIVYRTGQIVVTFDCGNLDLFEGEPYLKGAEGASTIQDRTETVLANSQILAGKIAGRGAAAPVRDLYDIAVAGRVDEPGLEKAVNCVGDDTFGEMINQWRAAERYYRLEAAKKLTGVPDRYKHISVDPVEHAIRAATDARYKGQKE